MITTDLDILKAKNLPATAKEAQEIIEKLEKELKASPVPGVGLAAPQIGINKRVAIVRTQYEQLDLVNPTITEKHHLFINKGEGCLSVPGCRLNTWRYGEIVVVDDLHPSGFVAAGFEAIVIQHEVDHIDSILIMERSAGTGKIGRNDPCPCGAKRPDGKPIKYKKCHGQKG